MRSEVRLEVQDGEHLLGSVTRCDISTELEFIASHFYDFLCRPDALKALPFPMIYEIMNTGSLRLDSEDRLDNFIRRDTETKRKAFDILEFETMEIDATTTAADVLARLRPRFLRQFALSMNLSGRELKSERLVYANPWLQFPLEIVVADRPAESQRVGEYRFMCQGCAVLQHWPQDVATGTIAREQFARTMGFPLASLWIYRKERLVQNSERLKTNGQYMTVQTARIKTVTVSLEPVPADLFKHKVTQELSFDVDKKPNLSQLSAMLAGLLSLPSVNLSKAGDPAPLPGAADLNELANVQVSFIGPSSPEVSYRFSMRGPTKGKTTLVVGSDDTILDVKAGLGGTEKGVRRLPRVFSLWFWGCEFQDGHKFLEYGIPANCKILVEFRQEWELKVRELGAQEISYVFSELDSIDELETIFYRAHPDVAKGTIGTFVGDTRLVGSEFMKQFERLAS
jgi:hypothetical protein